MFKELVHLKLSNIKGGQQFYSLLAECWIVLKWSLLKLVAVAGEGVFGLSATTENTIIRIGNIIFKRHYPNSLYKDYNAYVTEMAADLSTYQKLLPKELWLTDCTILDLGSGLGQYSNLLKETGARRVVSLEYQYEKVCFSAAHYGQTVFCATNASAEAIPYKEKTFDAIFSHTVFEHLSDVKAALFEASRVLKETGYILLSYNFIHHRGGHHLFPYIHFPWAPWIINETALCRYWSSRLEKDQAEGKMFFYKKGSRIVSLKERGEISLNMLNYDEFEGMLEVVGLKIHRRISSETIGNIFPSLLKIRQLKFYLSGTIYYLLRKV